MKKQQLSSDLYNKKRKIIIKETEKAQKLLVEAFKCLERADQEAISIPNYGTSGSLRDFQQQISRALSTDNDEAGIAAFIKILKK